MKYTTGMSLRKQLEENFEADGSSSDSNSEDSLEEPHRETEIVQVVDETEKKNNF